MRFTFEPAEENIFKAQAIGCTIVTIVEDTRTSKEIQRFTRRVRKYWTQSCKNNIETDHRIKALKNDIESENYIVSTRIIK